jgi:hypothetical protein
LVFVVDACRARLDEGFREFEGVQHAAEARLAVGDNRRVPIDVVASQRVLFLVLAAEGVVDALHDGGHAVDRVQAQVGIGLQRKVRVGGDLPPAEVNRLQPRLHHLHGLRARECAQRSNIRLGVQQLPQPLRPQLRQRILDLDRPAQTHNIRRRIRARNPLPARILAPITL